MLKHFQLYLFLLMSFTVIAQNNLFDKQRPNGISDQKWAALMSVIQDTKLIAESINDNSGNFLGSSVSISGNRALVSAPGDDENGNNSGAAYIFDFDGTNWYQSAKLMASNGSTNDFFGHAVSLFGDRAAVSSTAISLQRGAVYIFDLDAGAWSETIKLNIVVDQNAFFGQSISLATNSLLIGTPGKNNQGTDE